MGKENIEFLDFIEMIGLTEDGKISARKLHKFMGVRYFDSKKSKEVGSRFNDWINGRIKKYQFEENVDYIIIWVNPNGDRVDFNGSEGSMTGGGNEKDFLLSIDMAKELAMIQNNEMGRIARKHFLECERYILETKQKTEFMEFRNFGRKVRNDLNESMALIYKNEDSNQIKSWVESRYTNLIYKKLFGKDAKTIRLEHNLPAKGNDTRDKCFTKDQLDMIAEMEKKLVSIIECHLMMGTDVNDIYYIAKKIFENQI